MIIVRELVKFLGNNIHIVNIYLGISTIVAIFDGVFFIYFGILRATFVNLVSNFMKSNEVQMKFFDFYLAALITRFILDMHKKILIKISIKYLPAILEAIIFNTNQSRIFKL